MENIRPVAVMDSGVGGISVLRELRRLMPQENYCYFGDSANAPYGEKSAAEVLALSVKNAEMLFDRGAKALVVACNTATGAAIAALRERFPEKPVIGIEPALKPAALQKDRPTVLVMATPLTLRQEKFEHLLSQYNSQARIHTLPCHGLAEQIEQGVTEGDSLHRLLTDLLRPLQGVRFDSVVLGCTHYPLAKEAIRQALGYDVVLFDGGEGTARETRRRLTEADLLAPAETVGSVEWLTSSNDPEFPRLCERLLRG